MELHKYVIYWFKLSSIAFQSKFLHYIEQINFHNNYLKCIQTNRDK